MFKAKLTLALAEGVSYSRIESELNTSRPTIARWKARFEEGRLAGLESRHKGSRPPQGSTGGAGLSVEENSAEVAGRQHELVLPNNGESNWTEPRLRAIESVRRQD
ncbi:MAG: family transposase [Bryobacterales bacterium]|nr:family transposase [Bryobacterales bacterium]